ncbi:MULTISPECIES: NAD kinase [Cytobacillus]|uniref:NAD kinase n=1 Tax=Cytobacillus stercorigallinarum TaxID=2762240 RepID=A0ABR8QJ52_9BACI|nr:NAD kinase [Cytobacillus stercorigallinarum]MBD7935552.1 NAD kinase [Cytobacillus stercorigallinarum]
MHQRLLYFYHKQDTETLAIVENLKQQASNHGFTIVTDPKEATIIVSIGEDGAFLQAVRKTGFRNDCLYAGISTHGPLGIYCDFQLNEPSKMLEAAQNENIEVRKYPTIQVTVDGETSFQCLNEFSIRSSIIKTLVMEIYIDGQLFETFRGDGMIVSTPTGSTAYNKSVNGAIVDPMLPCLQVSELASLNNNKYRTLGSSFILGEQRTLTLKITHEGNDHPIMGMDNEALSIQHVDEIEITLSPHSIKTVKLKDNSFWEKVKRTFL